MRKDVDVRHSAQCTTELMFSRRCCEYHLHFDWEKIARQGQCLVCTRKRLYSEGTLLSFHRKRVIMVRTLGVVANESHVVKVMRF